MGRIAAKVFLEEVGNNSKGMRSEKKVVLEPELIIRKSSLKSPNLVNEIKTTK